MGNSLTTDSTSSSHRALDGARANQTVASPNGQQDTTAIPLAVDNSSRPPDTTLNPSNTTSYDILPKPRGDNEFSLNIFGIHLYPFSWFTLTTLTAWLGPISSAAMVIGCVMPYVPQYVTIHKAKSSRGFSTFVCLTLLLANILRIAFWFGHRFELPLLIQSVIMVIAQIALLELCVRVRRSLVARTIWTSPLKCFWGWTDLASYLEFLVLFSILLGIAVYSFRDCEFFIETIGYCALVSESMLGLPQVIVNYRKKSVEGMSLSMVLMWLAGDSFKTGYFIANAVPFQFWLCGLLQISIDIIILIQVCLYRQNAPMKSMSSESSPKESMSL